MSPIASISPAARSVVPEGPQTVHVDSNVAPPPWAGRMAISGVGMVTPVGLNATASCAALRAGISRIAVIPNFDLPSGDGEPLPVTGGTCDVSVTRQRQGPPRMARLAAHAIAEAIKDAKLPRLARVTLYLGLPAPHPGARILANGLTVARDIRQLLGDSIGVLDMRLFETGRGAALHALHQACLDLSSPPGGDATGAGSLAIVGGVDSWTSIRSLQYLLENGRLRDGDKSTGILPGEAAGFLIVERPERLTARRIKAHAYAISAASGYDATPPLKPNRAGCLSQCLQAIAPAVGPTTPAVPPLIISDLNGERHRANEWMFASMRSGIQNIGLPHWRAADSTGDTGAASGAVSAIWASTAFAKSYAPSPRCIVWGSSDEGLRHAFVMEGA